MRDALDSVHSNPEHAAAFARTFLASPDESLATRAEAMWLLGRAQHELDQVAEACSTLEDARQMALVADEKTLAAEISVSAAVCLVAQGEMEASLQLLVEAEPHLADGALGRLVMQRGLISLYRGAMGPALDDFDAAAVMLDAAGDDVARCRLLANRGVVHTNLGQLDLGLDDFSDCRALAQQLDQGMLAAGAAHNLGFLSGRKGEIPDALAWFDTARLEYERVGFPGRAVAVLESDYCSVLLAAGLRDEARKSAGRAVEAASASGNQLTLADALLQLALAQLSIRSDDVAAATAERAAAVFTAAGRQPLAVRCEYIALRASVAADTERAHVSLERAGEILVDLDEFGWVNEAHDVRLFIGQIALEQGDAELARTMLSAASEARRLGPWPLRVSGWFAVALQRSADGDLAGARRALRSGVRIIDDHQALLGAADLRAHITAHSADLIELGLELARRDGSDSHLFEWAERTHARSMRLSAARPPLDGKLSRLLGDLRGAYAVAAESAAAGRHDADADAAIARLESDVRNASRIAESGESTVEASAPERRDVVGLFTDRVLVEHVRIRDELIALAVVDGHISTTVLGRYDDVAVLQRHALTALRRLAFAGIRHDAMDAARNGLIEIGRDLDNVLFAPLGLPARRPIVLVPTGEMRSMPWSIMSTLAERPFAIAPSATTWGREPPVAALRSRRRALLVAGPGLAHADEEIDRLRHLYDDVVVIPAAESSTERVLDEMAQAQIVHIAAHGNFRNDSPLFSAIHLADGPLTVYDVERITTPPATVVLSACEAGRLAVRGGDELLGTAAALLHMGVSTVVAPITVVPDQAVVPLMEDLHRGLCRGDDVATALSIANRNARERGTHNDLAAANSFLTMSGDQSTPAAPAH